MNITNNTFSPSSSHYRRRWTEKIKRFSIRFGYLEDTNQLPVFGVHYLLSAFVEACMEMETDHICPLKNRIPSDPVRKYTRIHWQNALIYFWGTTGKWPSKDDLLFAMLGVEEFLKETPWAVAGIKRERDRMFAGYRTFRMRVEADGASRPLPSRSNTKAYSGIKSGQSLSAVQKLINSVTLVIQADAIQHDCDKKMLAASKMGRNVL